MNPLRVRESEAFAAQLGRAIRCENLLGDWDGLVHASLYFPESGPKAYTHQAVCSGTSVRFVGALTTRPVVTCLTCIAYLVYVKKDEPGVHR